MKKFFPCELRFSLVRNKVRRYLPPYPHSLIKTIFTEKTGTSEGTERPLTETCHSSPIVGTISVNSPFFHRVDAKVPTPWEADLLCWAATQNPRNPRDRDLRRRPFSDYQRVWVYWSTKKGLLRTIKKRGTESSLQIQELWRPLNENKESREGP